MFSTCDIAMVCSTEGVIAPDMPIVAKPCSQGRYCVMVEAACIVMLPCQVTAAVVGT